MRKFVSGCVAAMLAAAGSQAHAEWHQATSKHFVIYADENPKDLSDFATRLERFDQAVRFIRGMDDPPVGHGNRLTVFVLRDIDAVQQLLGFGQFVEGFYTGRASGSYAFVPRRGEANEPGSMSADVVFFHEYSHHLMFQIIDKPLPEWVIEGFAEFMSTVRFEKNGDIGIGAPANHRAYGLFEGDRLPLETMLSGNYSKITAGQRESIYGRGWLLIHYLSFEPSRAGQLQRYVDLLSNGVPGRDAARTAFGDLKQLDKELDSYLLRKTLSYLRLPGSKFPAGQIDVRPLAPGASKVILLRAQSKRGVNDKTAEPLAAKVRAVEAQYPGDDLVELTLAEAELDAGHVDAAEAAADRALKANPRDTKAMVFKGRSIEGRADKLVGDGRHAAFGEARAIFISANKLDTEDPEPLMEFYKSYVEEGIPPTQNAIEALRYASELAPQDDGLRLTTALTYLNEGKASDAKHTLTVVAYDPHGGDLAKLARTMIEKIDAGDAKDAISAAVSQSPSVSRSR
jgi:tetratricopeptide (TPR) repeat protein